MLSIRLVMFVVAAAAAAASPSQAPPPGLKLSLSQSCITYGKDWGITKFLPSLQNLHAPDVHGKSSSPIGDIDYDLTSIVMHSIALAHSAVTLQPADGLQISVDLDVKATLNWHYHCWAASDSGSADLTLSGASVSFLLSINVSDTAPFYPLLSTHNVAASVADISFKLHGGASWLYNLFVSSFKDSIKSSIVSALRDAVNPDAINKHLATISEDRQLTTYAALNFDILQPPTITAHALTFDMLGQILPTASSPPYPITPSPLPDAVYGSMIEIIFDQTLLSTASTTLYTAGIFAHSITHSDSPKLNTSNFCFLSSSLCQQYPDEAIVVTVAAAAAPSVNVSPSGVSLFLNVSITFSANSSSGVLSTFLNMSASGALAASLALGNNASGAIIITAHFTMPQAIDIEVTGSSIGPLDVKLLSEEMNDIAKSIALPWINYKGQHEGFAIPVPPGLQLSNSSVSVGASYVSISSDVHLQ